MLEPGLEASIEQRVTEDMTAAALGSGDVPVLGTPAVLALVERAACAAVDGRLPEGRTSVGTRIELSHRAPTPIGARVTATARLKAVDGDRLTFEVEVGDPAGPAATGTHTRVVVDVAEFLRSSEKRAGEPS